MRLPFDLPSIFRGLKEPHPKGFYSALHIVLVLGFMALARIRRTEGLRQVPPREFGKVIGLDRVPEVRTLREKIPLMAKRPLRLDEGTGKAVDGKRS